jgi:NAD(P)-dependent dehydrogenase (short-subunit alcohol dehydrogenase family)
MGGSLSEQCEAELTRIGTPADVAATIGFPVSEDAGATYNVAGGLHSF